MSRVLGMLLVKRFLGWGGGVSGAECRGEATWAIAIHRVTLLSPLFLLFMWKEVSIAWSIAIILNIVLLRFCILTLENYLAGVS